MIKNIIRKENGSITLEAALIMPFFLLFIVFLATLIRISVADMALYKATSETSEVIVAFAYPAEIAISSGEKIVTDKIKSVLPDDIEFEELAKWTDEGLKFFFDIDIQSEGKDFLKGIVEGPLEEIIQKKFEEATGGESIFQSKDLKVTDWDLGADYLKINVSFELDISFPFVNKTIILRKTSYERLWTGS